MPLPYSWIVVEDFLLNAYDEMWEQWLKLKNMDLSQVLAYDGYVEEKTVLEFMMREIEEWMK